MSVLETTTDLSECPARLTCAIDGRPIQPNERYRWMTAPDGSVEVVRESNCGTDALRYV